MASNMSAPKWRSLVEPRFSFLRIEFECSLAETSDRDWWCTRAVYQNSTTAVEVDYSIEFDRVEVQLVRLVDGRRPPYPIFVTEQPVLHHFLLDDLLELRAPELLDQTETAKGLDPAAVETQLSFWATSLREHGTDVLRGDFGVFAEMEAVIRENVRRRPEQITVWSPASAEGPDLAMLGPIRKEHPDIAVIGREYRQHDHPTARPARKPRRPRGER